MRMLFIFCNASRFVKKLKNLFTKKKFAEFINQVPSRDELRAILKWDPEGKGDISK